jgi:acyl dehydratase
MLYFEDLEINQKFELGSYTITKEEIIRFAKEFDPQPFHIDEEKAKSSLYGSLIASGWHTNSIYMKLFVKEMMSKAHGMGSPGIEELKWSHSFELYRSYVICEEACLKCNNTYLR